MAPDRWRNLGARFASRIWAPTPLDQSDCTVAIRPATSTFSSLQVAHVYSQPKHAWRTTHPLHLIATPGVQMPEYIIRLVQVHESFRKAELQALADLASAHLELVKYDENVSRNMHAALLASTSSAPFTPPTNHLPPLFYHIARIANPAPRTL